MNINYDHSKTRNARDIAEKTFHRRSKILKRLSKHKPLTLNEINKKFNYEVGCLRAYLNSLVSTGNVEKIHMPGRGVFYKFVKYYE
jgi:predicted transcriptional regulator